VVDDSGILPWLDRMRADVPGVKLLDVHTHIGSNDPDEYRCTRQELVERLEKIDAHAAVFPMHEPDGYPAANDMVIAESEASGGRLFPFCRLDPAAQPLEEARRALDAGARGIKLHPRAEGFTLDHPDLQPVFELAHERRLPILCHAGRGIPALGRHSIEVCSRFPGLRLILAHAGISDLSWIWREAADHLNLFFDTAWWSPSDVQALFALVPPGQILMGSDAPYATPAFGATMALRHGLQVGLSADVLRELAGGQALRLIDGEEPLDLGPPAGIESLSRDPLLERVYSFLISAIGQMFNGVDARESLALARLACDVGHDAPHGPVFESIVSLLDAQAGYDATGDGRPRRLAPGVHLIVVAAVLARTPDVALPESPRFAAGAPGSATT
jgi:predicted TIM-barrel fold metal-dependent hydrolase